MLHSRQKVPALLTVVWLILGLPLLACDGKSQNEGVLPDASVTCQSDGDCEKGSSCREKVCQPNETPDGGSDDDASAPDKSDCEPGTAACRCTLTGKCQSGLRCESGICQTCNEGTAGCACKGGKTCNSGLRCESGVCLGCVGKANCPCYGSGHCDSGFKCEYADNGANSCKSCKGETGCNCDKDSDCGGTMLCANKRCTPKDAANKIPKNPLCYSTCESNVKMPDGTIKPCHTEFKLKEGCGAGETCHEGSCLTEKEVKELNSSSYPFCASDANCPSWQGCVEGRCYSTCTSTSECPNGFQCHMYVCRRECNVRTKPCDNKYTCSTKGAEDGVCMPLPTNKPSTPSQNTTSGTFLVSYPNLPFSPLTKTHDLFITNKSTFATDFTISRSKDSIGSKTPLSWIKFDLCKTYSSDGLSCEAFEGKPSLKEPFTIENVPPNQIVIVRVSNASGKPSANKAYFGTLKVKGTQLDTKEVNVDYREKLDGQWKGTMVAFGNFDDSEIAKIRDKNADIRSFKNAFLRRWINYKRGDIDRDQLMAIMRSVQEGSWDFQKVKNDCKTAFSAVASPDVVCYPYKSAKGYEVLSNSQREAAIPSGSSELSFAMNIKEGSSNSLTGRIVTGQTLQYPGNPAISFTFEDGFAAKDKVFMRSMDATIDIGGRYYVDDSTACSDPTNFSKSTIPWMVPGFALMSYDRPGSLFRDRFDCRAQTVPRAIPAGATDAEKTTLREYNKSLSRSNPIPNGWRLRRKLQLVDGVLIDARYMFIIYKETFVSFFNSADQKKSALDNDFVNYGFMFLRRNPAATLEDNDYKGSAATTLKTCTSDSSCGGNLVCRGNICRPPSKLKQVACTSDIVKAAVGTTISNTSSLRSWSTTNLKSLISALMGNQPTAVSGNSAMQIKRQESGGDVEYSYTKDSTKHYIHYYCEDTKQFNGGPTNDPKDCPVGSKVIYFSATVSESDMRSHECQTATNASKTCDVRLDQLRSSADFLENVPYKCAKANDAFCESNRKDMREGKIFFKPSSNTFVSSLQPLRNALFEAFRYRIKFQSRSGKNVGFTPELCSQVAKSQTPYCYDPKVIEQLEQRVNCLEAIYADTTILNKLDGTTKASVKDYLAHAFAFSNRKVNGVIFTDPGFETLNAELKVMLGDESFTRSFASRYDLANTNLVSFQGSLLEPNGIDVSGALGYEMYNLYLSTQYYQMVLDRFFSTSNLLHQTFANRSSSFVTSASVTSYFQKLLLASTRKARSWSQIAKRYHALNRADLAKHVVERAYAATFMEMTILTRLLRELMKVLDANQIDQLTSEIKKVALTYKSSLLDMQETYKKLSLDADQFGFQKGYIPFPAMDSFCALTGGCNAFQTAMQFAQRKMAIAKNKEQIALQTKRQFDTSAAQFQSELVRIQQNYEGQLQEICGGITIADGDGQTRVVPAIPKYAPFSEQTRNLGDPCGRMPGGSLYNAIVELSKVQASVAGLKQSVSSTNQKITLEKDRIDKYCKAKLELADITWKYRGETKDLQIETEILQQQIERTQRVAQTLSQAAEMVKCSMIVGSSSGGDCVKAPFAAKLILGIGTVLEGGIVGLEVALLDKRKEQLELERNLEKTQLQFECNACNANDSSCKEEGTAQLESKIRIKEYTSSLMQLSYEAIKAEYDMRIAQSNIIRLQQRARRLMTQLEETTQLTINVQAAQNDPNTRIYKNDAIISAERTFEEAMKEAYRTTLIYEYYTGQTYARKGELYLIRMITAGDKNLEAYLSQLEQAFREFEEQNGKPDIRVLVLSLRDDILKLDRVDGDTHKTRVLNDRVAELQKILTDRNRLDQNGYTSISFDISVTNNHSLVSPVTFNHKILYIEAEIKSTSKGDDVGRLYLRQKGTSMVRQSDGEIKYYTLPQRTAVINPFFNGLKIFTPEVYRNFRLRDRPLGNTQWELLINQVSEKANQDIDLNSTSDIKLYIYYTDFTKEN